MSMSDDPRGFRRGQPGNRDYPPSQQGRAGHSSAPAQNRQDRFRQQDGPGGLVIAKWPKKPSRPFPLTSPKPSPSLNAGDLGGPSVTGTMPAAVRRRLAVQRPSRFRVRSRLHRILITMARPLTLTRRPRPAAMTRTGSVTPIKMPMGSSFRPITHRTTMRWDPMRSRSMIGFSLPTRTRTARRPAAVPFRRWL